MRRFCLAIFSFGALGLLDMCDVEGSAELKLTTILMDSR